MSLIKFLKSSNPQEVRDTYPLPVLAYPWVNERTLVTMATVASVTTVVSNVTSDPAQLVAVRVNTAIGSTAPLIYDGQTVVTSIPVGTAARADISMHEMPFRNGINVHAASVAGGSSGAFIIIWKPLIS